MSDQLEFFGVPSHSDQLTVSEGFEILFQHHLAGKPSARPFNSNRKAWCKTTGHVYLDVLTEPEVVRHVSMRTASGVGPQTICHDLKLLTLMFNTFRRWKRLGYTVGGFNFTPLQLPVENPTAYIKRPKTRPRQVMVPPNDFARWCEHCPDRLLERTYFAMFTGLNPIDLRRLRPEQYNAYTDTLSVQRHKTGAWEALPVPDVCRPIILRAIQAKQEFILDWTNHDKDVKATRKASGVYFWFGRDLRKTYGNEILRTSGSHALMKEALIHEDMRTTFSYVVRSGDGLRPALRKVEEKFLSVVSDGEQA